MNKRILLSAALVALSFQGVAYAADTNTPAPNKPQQNQTDPQATPTERPASTTSDKTNRPQEAKDDAAYQAKLKKCDGMSNASDKQSCTDRAKKERDQM